MTDPDLECRAATLLLNEILDDLKRTEKKHLVLQALDNVQKSLERIVTGASIETHSRTEAAARALSLLKEKRERMSKS